MTGLFLEGAGLVHPNGQRALRNVSLSVDSGERVGVIGPSGAGKTTLVRLLGTSLRPSEGQLFIGDTDPWHAGAGALRQLRARIGVIHQSPPIPPRLRVVTAVLAAESEGRGATLLASLHAVDLALKWFPRLIGMKAGEIVFDRPTAAVTTAMLHDLYATEGRALPQQGLDVLPDERPANVVLLKRPGCQ